MLSHLHANGAVPINFDINVEADLENLTWTCDITNDGSIRDSVQAVINYYGRIDGLINNAYPRTSDFGSHFEDVNPDSWRKNVDWQLNSYFVMCQEVLKQMRKQKSGAVVNIASIYGVVGNDFTIYEGTPLKTAPAYSAIKGGLINFSRYLASYYGQFNVRVNSVSPGGIFDNQDPKFVAAYEKKVPMKRMGNPKDIAPAVSFLLSDEAGYITGQNLIVDGGWTAI
jgi:NAD(P)-dependent dehydrogenase (short-subunit alcohol dehydrogenase family)